MSAREEIEALGFKVPDSVEPIVAYRSWQLSGGLVSHNHTLWKPGEVLKAECISRDGHWDSDSPSAWCACGIYAANARDASLIVPRAPSFVFGEVYLWGKILEGPRGYRAEYAYPKQFFVSTDFLKKKVEALGFGVPVTVNREGHPFGFPFPTKSIRRSSGQVPSPVALLSGLPTLVVGVAELFLLDMSRTFNQVLASIVLSAGLLAAAISVHLIRLRRRVNRLIHHHVAISNVQRLAAMHKAIQKMGEK